VTAFSKERIKSAGLFAGLMTTVLVLVSCASVNMPAITETKTNQRLPGKIVWHDLITDTPEQSQAFYSGLFGWEFEAIGRTMGMGSNSAYTIIRHEGRMIGGMIDQNKLRTTEDISQWMPLMSVDDMGVALARVQANSGTVLTPETEMADRGSLAVIADPQGAYIALVRTHYGDPVDRAPNQSDFLWNELWTTDLKGSSQFYMSLGGFDKETKVLDDDINYHFLSHNGKPRVGMIDHPVPNIGSVWVAYIKVKDVDEVLSKVEALGGEILVPARERDIGGKVALIAGPSGAGIAIQTWDKADEERLK